MRKYLPDVLILSGVWIFSYVALFPLSAVDKMVLELSEDDYTYYYKFLAIILISIGIDLFVRKSLVGKNNS